MDAQETSIFTAVLISSVVIGIIILYFIISIVRQQRRSLQLYRKSILTEITTLERERARIAADLHDEIGPMLSAIKLRMNSFDLVNEDDREQAAKTNQHIDGLIKRMREISYDLMPNTLIRKGLVMALKEFVEFSSRESSLQIRLQADESVQLEAQQAINLYRIVQEIIHNAIKYSEAQSMEVALRRERNTLILAARDNGKGFTFEGQVAEQAGLGLRNILSRTEIMGGRMFLDSAKGKGTHYLIEIPLPHAS